MNHLTPTQLQSIRKALDADLSLRLISIEGNTSINTAVRYRLYYRRGICGNCLALLHDGLCQHGTKRTVKDAKTMTIEMRAAIMRRFRAELTPKPAQSPPARVTPPTVPRRAPTPASAAPLRAPRPVFVMPPKRSSPDTYHPDRAADLAAQERFLAERGATVLPPSNDPMIMDLPQMTFDHHTKKWTRRANAQTRMQWTRKQAAE